MYFATKAFVLSFTEALHEEVGHTNLHVSCLCPGPTDTGFVSAAHMEGVNLFKMGADSAESVAHIGYAAFARNRAVVISGWKNIIGAWSTRFAPRVVSRRIAMMLNS